MNTVTESRVTSEAATQKPGKKANVGKKKPHVAPAKGKASKKASLAKEATKAPKTAKAAKPEPPAKPVEESKKPKPTEAHKVTKTDTVLGLIQQPNGATLAEIMQVTGWQAHSVRGFISGTLGKKMGLRVESAKRENGERAYSLKS